MIEMIIFSRVFTVYAIMIRKETRDIVIDILTIIIKSL